MARFFKRRDTKIPSLSVPLPLEYMQRKLDATNSAHQSNVAGLAGLGLDDINSIDVGLLGGMTEDRKRYLKASGELTKGINEVAENLLDPDNIQNSIQESAIKINALRAKKEQIESGEFKFINAAYEEKLKSDEAVTATGATAGIQKMRKDKNLENYQDSGSFRGRTGTGQSYTSLSNPDVFDYDKFAGKIADDTFHAVDQNYGWIGGTDGAFIRKRTKGETIRLKDDIVGTVMSGMNGNPKAIEYAMEQARANHWNDYLLDLNNGIDVKTAGENLQKKVDYEYNQINIRDYNKLDPNTVLGGLAKAKAETYQRDRRTTTKGITYNKLFELGGGSDVRYKGAAATTPGVIKTTSTEDFQEDFNSITNSIERNNAAIAKGTNAKGNFLQPLDIEALTTQRNAAEDRANGFVKQLAPDFEESTGTSLDDMYDDYTGDNKGTLTAFKFKVLTNSDYLEEVTDSLYGGKRVSTNDAFIQPQVGDEFTSPTQTTTRTSKNEKYKNLKDKTSSGFFGQDSNWKKTFNDLTTTETTEHGTRVEGSDTWKRAENAQLKVIKSNRLIKDIYGNVVDFGESDPNDGDTKGRVNDPVSITPVTMGDKVYNTVVLKNGSRHTVPVIDVESSMTQAKQLYSTRYNTKLSDEEKSKNAENGLNTYTLLRASKEDATLDPTGGKAGTISKMQIGDDIMLYKKISSQGNDGYIVYDKQKNPLTNKATGKVIPFNTLSDVRIEFAKQNYLDELDDRYK